MIARDPDCLAVRVTVEFRDDCPDEIQTWPKSFRDSDIAKRFATAMEKRPDVLLARVEVECPGKHDWHCIEEATCGPCGWHFCEDELRGDDHACEQCREEELDEHERGCGCEPCSDRRIDAYERRHDMT